MNSVEIRSHLFCTVLYMYTYTLLHVITGHKADPRKHVLIMDEVDGMAGNEDRGGMQVRKAMSVSKCCRI